MNNRIVKFLLVVLVLVGSIVWIGYSSTRAHLFVAQLAEEMQFDDFNLPGVESCKLRPSLIECQHVESRLD